MTGSVSMTGRPTIVPIAWLTSPLPVTLGQGLGQLGGRCGDCSICGSSRSSSGAAAGGRVIALPGTEYAAAGAIAE